MVANACSFDPTSSFAFSLVSSILHRDHISLSGVASFFAYILDLKLPQSSGRALSTTLSFHCQTILPLALEVDPSSQRSSRNRELFLPLISILYNSFRRDITSLAVVTENSSTSLS